MRTPATIPVRKSLDDCRELVFSRVQDVHEEYTAKGWLPARLNLNAGIVRGLLEIFAWVLFAFYTFLLRSLPNAFPLQAEEGWLDLHADQIELARLSATKTLGLVLFMRAAGHEGNIRIPSGRIVRTKPDGRGVVYRYITTEEAVLPAGEDNVAVPVAAEEYGQASNATAGQICELSTHIPGISGVTNTADWLISEGADEETDARLHERYVLAWLELAGCTASAYESWARSVPGVQSVKILDNHPYGEGTVGVIVIGTAGIPTETLLGKVRTVIAEKNPVNDAWQVHPPKETPVILDCIAEVVDGSLDTAGELVTQRLRALFAGSGITLDDVEPFGIGDDFTRDRAVAANVGRVDGLKRLVWSQPVEDLIVVPDDGLAVLAGLTVTPVKVAA
jgi:Uncharacterized homolog of phage Mu protein gp47